MNEKDKKRFNTLYNADISFGFLLRKKGCCRFRFLQQPFFYN